MIFTYMNCELQNISMKNPKKYEMELKIKHRLTESKLYSPCCDESKQNSICKCQMI